MDLRGAFFSAMVPFYLAGLTSSVAMMLLHALQGRNPIPSPWTGTFLSLFAPLVFFIVVATGKIWVVCGRKPQNLFHVHLISIMGTFWSFRRYYRVGGDAFDRPLPAWLAPAMALCSAVSFVLYDVWYAKASVGPARTNLHAGAQLPDITGPNALSGAQVSLSRLLASPSVDHALIVFLRGNWCPICMTQAKELAALMPELEHKRVKALLIVPQPVKENRELAQSLGPPSGLQVVADSSLTITDQLGIRHRNGVPPVIPAVTHDTAYASIFLVDKQRRLKYVFLPSDYRVRPPLQKVLERGLKTD